MEQFYVLLFVFVFSGLAGFIYSLARTPYDPISLLPPKTQMKLVRMAFNILDPEVERQELERRDRTDRMNKRAVEGFQFIIGLQTVLASEGASYLPEEPAPTKPTSWKLEKRSKQYGNHHTKLAYWDMPTQEKPMVPISAAEIIAAETV